MHILARLNHPNLATLYHSGKTSAGDPYYMMELIEGSTLDKWATNASLDERLRLFTQVVEAVAYAHKEGIAHRDLKPANILVTRDTHEAKIIDFGIARATTDPTQWGRDATVMGQRMGTPRYMSPEQLAGDPHVDLRTDIWSLGLILYELVLKHPVLAGISDSNVSWEQNGEALRNFTFQELPDRELDWIARKACTLDRKHRYQSGRELLDDLTARERGEAVSVGLSHRGYRFRKSLRQHRLAWVSGISLLTILIAATIGSWLMMRHEQKTNREIAESLEREKEQADIATQAELEMRRASSDTALLASVRASRSHQYSEARKLLDQALTLWPENKAAQFSRNFLNATLPETRFLENRELPFPVLSAQAHPEGGFILHSTQDRIFHLGPEGQIKKISKPLPNQANTETEFSVIQTRDLIEFKHTNSQDHILAPLVLDSSSKLATYSHQDAQLLIYDGTTKIEIREAGKHLTGFQETSLSEDSGWLEFSRDSHILWIGTTEQKLYKWEGTNPPEAIGTHEIMRTTTPWTVGEGHDRGLPNDVSSLLVLIQVSAWQVGGDQNKITLGGNSRLKDITIVARVDGTVWVRQPGSIFSKIAEPDGQVSAIAINATGTTIARILDQKRIELIDPSSKKITHAWSLPTPAHEVSLLDTGEIVITHHNGTVTVWDAQSTHSPRFTIPVSTNAPQGFHIRAVPNKPEFVCCLDGDIVIHHFSALDGKKAGLPIRHIHSIHWMQFSGEGDLLITVDQAPDTKSLLRVWSLRLGSEIVPAIEHPEQILWATILDNGKRLATSCVDKKVRRWTIEQITTE